MKKMAFVLSLVVALLGAALSAEARDVVLRYNYLPGESRTYGMGLTGTGTVSVLGVPSPLEFSFDSAVTQNCTGVKDDGAMELEMVSSPPTASVSLAGEPLGVDLFAAEETPMSLLLYPDGRVEIPEGATSPAKGTFAFLGIQLDPYQLAKAATSTLLPEEPVSEGKQWVREVDVPFPAGKTAKMTVTSTLSGFQEKEGVDCVVLDTDFSFPFSLDFTGLGIALEGWATGKIREFATVEQMKTIEQTGEMSLSLSSPAGEQTGEEDPMAQLGVSAVEATINASFNLHLLELGSPPPPPEFTPPAPAESGPPA